MTYDMKTTLKTNLLSELESFHHGLSCAAYTLFGCHYIHSLKAHRFLVWAPNARSISLIGNFNSWDENSNIMDRLSDNVFIAYMPGLDNGSIYKYAVTFEDGRVVHKADPFACHSETGPKTGSRIWDISGFEWHDAAFRRLNSKKNTHSRPMTIYEVHIGSWRRKEDEIYPWYRNVADSLAEYSKDMGYTHVELMPVTEYPFDGSWGYQVTGYFSPTSRYGTPQDFMYFVDTLHANGISVIIDWVPAHFPRDSHGLAAFDGTAQYERTDVTMASHPQWGTLIFDYEKPEVRSFLISSACFFSDIYHVDGLRVDAVSSMLYLDYCRDGGYVPNENGGNIDLGAVSLLRELNKQLNQRGCIAIAEESSNFPGVTKQLEDGGLGFTFKWDMGFMHDTLDYFAMDPLFRRNHHNKLTFSMMYAFNENYILAFSHDEVVHEKKSMLDKMYGDYDQKFASLRTLFGYQYAHPGKKLNFMGSEFAQFIEWDFKKELDWFLLRYPRHDSMLKFVRELNHFYLAHPSLYRVDSSWDGFEWLNVNDIDRSCLAFLRRCPRGRTVICVCNFTPVTYDDFLIGINRAGVLRLALNSDESRFGGTDSPVEKQINTVKGGFYGYSHSASLALPPMSCLYYEFTP